MKRLPLSITIILILFVSWFFYTSFAIVILSKGNRDLGYKLEACKLAKPIEQKEAKEVLEELESLVEVYKEKLCEKPLCK